jgi:hypothetical protein
MTCNVMGRSTIKLRAPETNMAAIGTAEFQNTMGCVSPNTPDRIPSKALPGKVKARRAGRHDCNPK